MPSPQGGSGDPAVIPRHDGRPSEWSPRARWLSVACLLALVVAAYANGLTGDFQFDDTSNILESKAIRQFDFSGRSVLRLIPDSPEPSRRRPVAVLSFAVNGRITGLTPLSLHAWNLGIHLLNVLLVYLLARAILERVAARPAGRSHPASLLAAGLWAMNPVNTQAVTYLVQRMTSLMTAFYLAACLLFIRARSTGAKRPLLSWTALVALFLLALGTKESAITLPAILLLLEVSLFTPPGRFFGSARRMTTCVLVAAAATALVLALFGGSISLSSDSAEKGFDSAQRLLTQPRVLWWYVSVFLIPLPSRLNLDIDFPASTGLLAPPSTLAAIAAWFAIAAWALARFSRQRLAAMAILWYLLASSVESSFLMLDMAYLHRLYLPMVLPSIWFADSALGALRAAEARLPEWAGKGARILPWAIILCFGFGTVVRNSVLASETALWEDTVVKSPGKARPHFNLGLIYQEQLRTAEAEREYLRAIELRPDYFRPYANLVPIYMSKGQFTKALPHLEKALLHGGRYSDVQFLAGKVYETLGDRDRALEHFLLATTGLQPHNRQEALWRISLIHRSRGDREKEARTLGALAAEPPDGGGFSTLGSRRLAEISTGDAGR